MRSERGIWADYRAGWTSLTQNWRVLPLIYGINLLMAFVAIGPLTKLLSLSLSRSPLGTQLANGFDYTLVTDLIRHGDFGLQLSVAVLGSFILIYALWAIFCQGGYMALIRYSGSAPLTEFWKGGAYYFFRFLRLSLYVAGLCGVFLLILATFLRNKTNPFELNYEGTVLRQMWILLGLFLVICFLLHTVKEMAKNYIARIDHAVITTANRQALRQSASMQALGLSLINLIVLLLCTALYFGLRKICGSALLPALLIGQVFLLFRIAYKYVRLASFHAHLNRKNPIA